MSRLKMHLAFFGRGGVTPTLTRCGRKIGEGVMVKIIKDDDPERYKHITCHYCRWGRIP